MDISQLIVHCAVSSYAICIAIRLLYAAKVSAVQLDNLQLEANKIGP